MTDLRTLSGCTELVERTADDAGRAWMTLDSRILFERAGHPVRASPCIGPWYRGRPASAGFPSTVKGLAGTQVDDLKWIFDDPDLDVVEQRLG